MNRNSSASMLEESGDPTKAGSYGHPSPGELLGAEGTGRKLFLLHDRQLAREVLAQAVLHGTSVQVLQRNVRVEARVRSAASTTCLAMDETHAARLWPGRPAVLAFTLFGAVFELHGRLSSDASGWLIDDPVSLYSVERRGNSRLKLGEGEASLRWSPADAGELVVATARVEDVTVGGLRLTTGPGAPVLPCGVAVPAELELGAATIQCLLQARYYGACDGCSVYGVRMLDGHEPEALIDAYLRQRFGRLRPRREVDAAALQTLFEATGYLSLRDDTTPERGWYHLDADDLSRDMVYVDAEEQPVGHVSVTRAYSKTWLGHRIAMRGDVPRASTARQTLYHYFASFPVLVDGLDTMLLGYYNRAKRWHQLFFESFVRWMGSPDLAVIAPFDRFEREEAGDAAAIAQGIPDGVDVGPIRRDELVRATALVRAQLPALAADAFDIHPRKLERAALHPSYESSGFERARSVLALRVRGELSGVALCETGSQSMSLFNIMNMAQVFVRTGAHRPALEAQLALLSETRRLYAARGLGRPLLVAPPGTLDAAAEPGTSLAETMGCIVWSGRALRQYESFLDYHFGSHEHKREGRSPADKETRPCTKT